MFRKFTNSFVNFAAFIAALVFASKGSGQEKVAIIMPMYNSMGTVVDAIASVRAQTSSNWVLYVINDASTDESAAIVASIALEDSRIKLIDLNKNGGPGVARNIGLELATENFIAFLDADDLWLPAKLEVQLESMRDEQSSFSFTAYRRLDADGEKIGEQISVPKIARYGDMLKHVPIVTSSVMIDRSKYADGMVVFPKDYLAEDYKLWLKLLKDSSQKALGINRNLLLFRRGNESISANKITMARVRWRALRDQGLSFPETISHFANYAVCNVIKYGFKNRIRGLRDQFVPSRPPLRSAAP